MAMVFIEVGDAYYLLLVMRASASRQIFHHLFFGGKEQQVSRQIQYLHVAVMEDLGCSKFGGKIIWANCIDLTSTEDRRHDIVPTITAASKQIKAMSSEGEVHIYKVRILTKVISPRAVTIICK